MPELVFLAVECRVSTHQSFAISPIGQAKPYWMPCGYWVFTQSLQG